MIANLTAVALGGAFGALSRFGLNRLVVLYSSHSVLLATFIANTLGCFLMGLAYTAFITRFEGVETIKLFVTVGFLGALTTWSTFSMETVILLQQGEFLKGIGYTVLTTVCCFTAFWLGMKI